MSSSARRALRILWTVTVGSAWLAFLWTSHVINFLALLGAPSSVDVPNGTRRITLPSLPRHSRRVPYMQSTLSVQRSGFHLRLSASMASPQHGWFESPSDTSSRVDHDCPQGGRSLEPYGARVPSPGAPTRPSRTACVPPRAAPSSLAILGDELPKFAIRAARALAKQSAVRGAKGPGEGTPWRQARPHGA